MDHRTALESGTVLSFAGLKCVIGKCIGRGSNAIVYEASYEDAVSSGRHHVLVKELFPLDPQKHIWRNEKLEVCRDEQGQAAWELHRESFERGNQIHLELLARNPEQIGGNLNTYALNNTLYTVLVDSGSRSLEKELDGRPAASLRKAAVWTRLLLESLDTFHSKGLLHLDISPDNILLIGEGDRQRVMLIDYNSVHTREEMLRGDSIYFSMKEGFTAPEVQAGMFSSITASTDLYAVTAVFYTCLMGRPATSVQLNRKKPPDARDSILLQDVPPTVMAQVQKMLHHGLCVLPDRRYDSCQAMLQDVTELINRIDGIGVTHAALWEAGRRNVRRLVDGNISLGYLLKDSELYRQSVKWTDSAEIMTPERLIEEAAVKHDRPILLTGAGGSGKTTALLHTVLSAQDSYSPVNPAILYVSLAEWRDEGGCFLLNRILRELRFDANTRTIEEARHTLVQMLSEPCRIKGEKHAVLVLLLDGLNEARGDTSGLLKEIRELSALEGISAVITSRGNDDGLDVRLCSMAELEDEDIFSALGRFGLLMPEKDTVRRLLKTPMMLSMYIKTALAGQTQIMCATESELLNSYLSSLCAKTGQEDENTRYRTEAAVYYVLPAIAGEYCKSGRLLTDQELLKTVTRCRKSLNTRALAGAFPQWIGHGREITGGKETDAETWYGTIVQEILWKKLGLLVRDESGNYHVLHQILTDYLASIDAANRRSVRRAKSRKGLTAACIICVLIGLMYTGYALWLKPKPYDETLSSMVMDEAVNQYAMSGLQYAVMKSVLNGDTNPAAGEEEIRRLGTSSRTAYLALNEMQNSDGTVIPWSGRKLDAQNCEKLLELSAIYSSEYMPYIRAFAKLTNEGRTEERAALNDVLTDLIEANADKAWILEQLVCEPHLQGMTAERRAAYDMALLSVPPIQETREVDTSKGLAYALKRAEESAREAKRRLSAMPVMYEEGIIQ